MDDINSFFFFSMYEFLISYIMPFINQTTLQSSFFFTFYRTHERRYISQKVCCSNVIKGILSLARSQGTVNLFNELHSGSDKSLLRVTPLRCRPREEKTKYICVPRDELDSVIKGETWKNHREIARILKCHPYKPSTNTRTRVEFLLKKNI